MRQHLSSAVWIVGGSALNALGTLVGVRILTQFLTPGSYGVVTLALGMSTLAISIVSTPLTQAAMHFYPAIAATGSVRDLLNSLQRCFLRMAPWPLGAGWYGQEGGFRWMAPHATATLTPSPGAQQFELATFVSSDQLKQTGPITVSVTVNGTSIGKRQLAVEGQQTLTWPVTGGGQASVEIDVTPGIGPSSSDTRSLGLAVLGFGFR